ncbi:MAG: tRNA (adenosine(37)-N6)-dimethylallyltransferase MiaA [Acidimicrobiia bacterium]
MVGHTASGKSAIAETLAERHNAAIVSVDSMQVYRGMDIGTAKPDLATQERIPHAMVDVVDPSEAYNAKQFQESGRASIDALLGSHGKVIIVGGSGLHFRSLVDPMTFAPTDPDVRADIESLDKAERVDVLLTIDPDAASVVDVSNPRRVIRAIEVHRITGQTPTERAARPEALALKRYQSHLPFTGFGLDAGEDSDDRIRTRFDGMLELGLYEEVESLLPSMGDTARHAVGYRELIEVLEERISIDAARNEALRSTAALVKRQRTFFNRDPRITWLPWHHDVDTRIVASVDAIEEAARWTS